MLIGKFRALLFRRGVIHQAIEAEQRRPSPDSIKLLRLKRLRLALKDQFAGSRWRLRAPTRRGSRR